MNWRKAAIRFTAVLFFFMLFGAIGSHILQRRAPLNGTGSASFLFIAGTLLILTTPRIDRLRLLVVGLIGYIMEVIGVNYGWLFGCYIYTDVLAPNVLGTPVVMVCAWFVLIGYVKQMMLRFSLPGWAEVSLCGGWMTLIDLLLDPIAAHPFNFWNWVDDGAYYGIPLQNFLGWFAVSVVILIADKILFRTAWQPNYWAYIVGLGIIFLYAVCAFGYGYFIIGMVGVALIVMHGSVLLSAKLSMRNSFLEMNSEKIAN